MAHLAPAGWQHINLTGDYPWDSDSNLGPDGFRSFLTPSNKTSHGRRYLIVFPIWSCIACYAARSMA